MSKTKPELIEKLINNTISIPEELNYLLTLLGPSEIMDISKRIFKLNDDSILSNSDSERGMMGEANRISTERRKKAFYKKMQSRFRLNPKNKVILAEGDSWFQFPVFIKDIIDWLDERPDYAIDSMAYAGDWLANMLYQGKYVTALQQLDPDVFLISGGGNDLVTDCRLASFVNTNSNFLQPQADSIKNSSITQDLKFRQIGNLYLNDEFYAFMNLLYLQYRLLFENIAIRTTEPNDKNRKYAKMKIITQGYDYAIPSGSYGWNDKDFDLLRPMVNQFIVATTGKWLKLPLELKGIFDPFVQRSIIYEMIEIFNNTMISIGVHYDNVFHIDCRGAVKNHGKWYDEMHPNDAVFKKIAEAYARCIDSPTLIPKVYSV